MEMKTRNYGIDLLRLVLMFMVCLLHVLGQGGVLAACQPGEANYMFFWLLKCLSFCAVDCFALISGYVAVNKPQNRAKLVDMWFQVWFYSCLLSVLLTVLGLGGDLSVRTLIKYSMPVSFEIYWYFSAYFVLFLAMPILNKALFEMEEATAGKVFLLMFALFSVLGIVSDAFQTHQGYSAIWLIMLYCMGVLAKRSRLLEKKPTWLLIALLLLCGFFTWCSYVLLHTELLLQYISPTMLAAALLLTVIFSRIRLEGKVLRKLAPLAFGIYLFQLNPVIWQDILKDSLRFVADMPFALAVVYVLACSVLIFTAGIGVEYGRSLLAKWLKLPVLSRKIVELIDKMLAAVVKLFA